ncbi:MAG: insulinase family protein [Clostridia bacterium]
MFSKRKIVKFNNGLVLLFRKRKINKGVYFRLTFQAGALNEGQRDGLAHLSEHCLAGSLGTKTRTKDEIIEFHKSLKEWNAYTSIDDIAFWFYSSVKDFAKAIDSIMDCLTNVKYDETEFENEKKVVIQEIKNKKQSVEKDCYEMDCRENYINKLIFAKCNVGGTAESVKDITFEEVLKHKESVLTLDNARINVVGNISLFKVKRIIKNKIFPLLPKHKIRDTVRLNDLYGMVGGNASITNSSEKEKSLVCFRFIIDKEEKIGDGIPFSYIGYALRYMSTKLYRDKYGLCYSSNVIASCGNKNIELFIKINCEENNVPKVLEVTPEFITMLKNIKFTKEDIKITYEHLQKSKDASMPISHKEIAQDMGGEYLNFGRFITWFEKKKIKWARKHIKPEKVQVLFDSFFKVDPYILIVTNHEFDKPFNYEEYKQKIKEAINEKSN